jgi:hypothetical protein
MALEPLDEVGQGLNASNLNLTPLNTQMSPKGGGTTPGAVGRRLGPGKEVRRTHSERYGRAAASCAGRLRAAVGL